jgi:N-acetylglucosamine kinase-like BadF-type ATPase
MILIADSGSTKTDWRFISSNGEISQYKTEGLNPFLRNEAEIAECLHITFESLIADKVKKIFFYGAGCKGTGKELLQKVLADSFKSANKIKVENDLLAAARATCGNSKGIACILGTGANSCLYNGEEITDHIPPLGYILGDEGSGAYLGKALVNAYFKRELPADLHRKFDKRYQLTESDLLEKVYKAPFPNRYLANYARFLHHNIKHTYVKHLVYEAFNTFFKKQIIKYEGYKQLPVHFTGSIAFYFNDILRYTATELNINLGRVLEKPIAGLTLFHEKDK